MTRLVNMTADQLEAAFAHCTDLAESLPKSEETRRIYNQVHARTLQERIDDLEAMRKDSLGCRQEGLGI